MGIRCIGKNKKSKMEILDFEIYLDGGTIEITTDKGVFCIDHRLQTNTEGKWYTNYPEDDNSNLIKDSDDLEKEILESLKSYKNEFYQSSIDDLLSKIRE